MVNQEGAAGAACFPSGAEHEVIDDELATSLEEAGEGFWPLFRVENILFLDPDPGQGQTLAVNGIAEVGELFFTLQEGFPGFEPGFRRDDGVIWHDGKNLLLD